MRCGPGLMTLAAMLGVQAVLAQASAQSLTQPVPAQPGVDIYKTLNPIPPSTTFVPDGRVPLGGAVGHEPGPADKVMGWNFGAYTVYPIITGAMFFDDNVFATATHRQSDFAFVARPEVAIRQTDRNSPVQFSANAFIEGRAYERFASENQVNGAGNIGMTWAVDADTQIVGRAQYVHWHEERGVSESLIFPTFDKPVAYDQGEGAAALNKRFGGWWTSVGAQGLVVHYDTPTVMGTPVPQNYRDGTVVFVPGRVGVVVAPLTSAFIEVAGNQRDWDVSTFDSQGYRVVGGVLLEPGPGARVKGEAFVGYMHQGYAGVTFQTVSTWTFGAAMAFLLADNLTATVEGRRDAKESALTCPLFNIVNCGVSVVETIAAARLDYLLRPNLVVSGGASYWVDQYLGTGRTDKMLSPLAALRYFVNPRVTFGLDYRHLTYSSDPGLLPPSPSYLRNVVMLSVHGKF